MKKYGVKNAVYGCEEEMGILESGVLCYEFLVISVICSQFEWKEFLFK